MSAFHWINALIRTRFLVTQAIRWITVAAVSLAMSSCDPGQPLPPQDAGPSAQGVEEFAAFDCSSSAQDRVADGLNLLCSLFGAGRCTTQQSNCAQRKRELFAGADLERAPSKRGDSGWAGIGGRGSLIDDAAICLLEDLANGEVVNSGSFQSAFGPFRVKQTVGLLHFDPVAKSVTGYEKLNVCLPVLGCFDATSQTFTASDRRSSPASTIDLYAGGYRILTSRGLVFESDESTHGLTIQPPSIVATTPYGPVTVQPSFSYQTNASVLFGPYGAPVDNTKLQLEPDGFHFFGPLQDIYGRLNGTLATTIDLRGHLGASGGWTSGVGLGQRDPDPRTAPWTASSDRPYRPDMDLSLARGQREKAPGVAASAQATIEYSPTNLLPSVLRGSPINLDFRIYVRPKFEAAASTQFDLSFSEGVQMPGDGSGAMFNDERVQASTQIAAHSALVMEAGMDLTAKINFPFPVGEITLVDKHPNFSVPLSRIDNEQVGSEAHAVSDSDHNANPIDYKEMKTFRGFVDGRSFVQACLNHPAIDQPKPQPEATPGDPAGLFGLVYYPCNVCVGNAPRHIHQGGVTYDNNGSLQMIFPSRDGSDYFCDLFSKIGCMDLCTFDPRPGPAQGLHIAKFVDELFPDRHCSYRPPP